MKSQKLVFCVVISILLITYQDINANNKLVKQWEASGFSTPECVILDAKNNCLYVSNIGKENSLAADGDGFISKLSLDGEIIELKWVESLNAPKGMGIVDNYLYVSDVNRLVKINIQKEEIEELIEFEGALFLNDVLVINNEEILISDSKGLCYYKYSPEGVNKFLCDTSFGFPNGLCLDGDYILSGVGNKVIKFTATDNVWTDYILETGGVDGLSKVDEGVYLISDWSGRVHLIYTDKEKELLLDTTNEKVNAADFYFDRDLRYVYIPTFNSNKVICYKLL